MVRVAALLRSPFSFLFVSRSVEERVAAYVIREHHRGRILDDILEDPYVRVRVSEDQAARLLQRAEVIRAVTDDAAEARRRVERLLAHARN